MRDILLDLVEHTYDLGCIDLIKITGDDKKTEIIGLGTDQLVIVTGVWHKPVAEFIGQFGMPNLGKLKILLNLQEYKDENTLITISKNADGAPDGINFSNASGDFSNNYRFMSSAIVTNMIKNMKYNQPNFHVVFEPTVSGIMRLKMQAQAHSEENNFLVKTVKNDLKFYFGDSSTHAGEFVFATNITGTIKRSWAYPIKIVISILDLVGDKTIQISDDGAMEIIVDSGITAYKYIIPANTK